MWKWTPRYHGTKSGAAFAHKKISCLAETVWKSIGSNPCTGKERSSIRWGNTKAESPEKGTCWTYQFNESDERVLSGDMGFLPEQNDGIKRNVSSSKHLCSLPCRRYLGCEWNDIVFERKKTAFQKARWSSRDSGKTIHTRACHWFFSVRADCEVWKSYNSL